MTQSEIQHFQHPEKKILMIEELDREVFIKLKENRF
jgi:hypothetical protein